MADSGDNNLHVIFPCSRSGRSLTSQAAAVRALNPIYGRIFPHGYTEVASRHWYIFILLLGEYLHISQSSTSPGSPGTSAGFRCHGKHFHNEANSPNCHLIYLHELPTQLTSSELISPHSRLPCALQSVTPWRLRKPALDSLHAAIVVDICSFHLQLRHSGLRLIAEATLSTTPKPHAVFVRELKNPKVSGQLC